MWRHSKKHVVEEIRLPPLHLQAVYLRFTAIEHEFYRKYLSDIKGQIINAVLTYQSNLDAKAGKKRSGSAAKDSILPMIASKLEGLRMVCDHPQVSTQSFLGVRVMTMPEIAAALRRKARDETTEHERKLARDYNALGLFYLSFPRQYSAEMAEKVCPMVIAYTLILCSYSHVYYHFERLLSSYGPLYALPDQQIPHFIGLYTCMGCV